MYTKDVSEWKDKDANLLSVVKEVRPNVLVGTSTKAGAFTEDVIRAMAEHHERPIVLPLSNPTRLHEAKPEDILNWTGGKALVATGSPFPAVKGPWGKNGEEITINVGECNNSVVFPGIGLGLFSHAPSILQIACSSQLWRVFPLSAPFLKTRQLLFYQMWVLCGM
ncbi:hypothetical protein NXS19_000979 [Fusarium pseudograminearum]|nr:hypothetical protein NXS19_000979 [Fusarium pseudograminearum]